MRFSTKRLQNGVYLHTINGPRGCGKSTRLADHLVTAVSFLPPGEMAMVMTPKLEMTKSFMEKVEHVMGIHTSWAAWERCQVLKRRVLRESFHTIDRAGRGCNVTLLFLDEMFFLKREDYDSLIYGGRCPGLREVYVTDWD